MADKLVFDSERLEKRQRLRRWLFPLLALLVLILIAVGAALLIRGRRGTVNTGGEGTAYPYTWQVGKNGVVTLELDRSAAPGYLWIPAEEGTLLDAAGEQLEGRTRFTLTPQGQGRDILVFALAREEDDLDRIYALSVMAEVTESGRSLSIDLLSFSGKALQGAVYGGEGSDYPYTLRLDEDGDLVLLVTHPEAEPKEETENYGEKNEAGWSCVSEDETVAEVLGVITADDFAAAYIRPGTEPGTVRVRMTDDVSGTEITLVFEADGSGTLLLRDHSLTAGNNG